LLMYMPLTNNMIEFVHVNIFNLLIKSYLLYDII
jgi:hypothetical protein